MPTLDADRLLIDRIRQGEQDAWADFIGRFEGRLIACVDSRLNDRQQAEDVVQETFLGFLIGLPNYDEATPPESFLFSIAAHKLTDVLRRRGRRPTLPLVTRNSQAEGSDLRGSGRMASSLARSRERRSVESQVLRDGLETLIEQWIRTGEFERLKCIELLFVLGWANKDAARELRISEQAVANHKHFVLSKLKDWVAASPLRGTDLAELGVR
ncbi:MAG: sigma-70 family RNA polymerase sigma factor [Planctomycetes bacterium]|nr:sigma-70 family RNA polymerase sigma factor [Planctomycetota bacterium]